MKELHFKKCEEKFFLKEKQKEALSERLFIRDKAHTAFLREIDKVPLFQKKNKKSALNNFYMLCDFKSFKDIYKHFKTMEDKYFYSKEKKRFICIKEDIKALEYKDYVFKFLKELEKQFLENKRAFLNKQRKINQEILKSAGFFPYSPAYYSNRYQFSNDIIEITTALQEVKERLRKGAWKSPPMKT